MSALRLTLRERPAQRVDCSPLTTASLAGRTLAEIAAIELPTGNRRVRLDALFSLAGEPGTDLEIAGSTAMLDRLGTGLAGGTLRVKGDAGAYLGMGMTAGTIEVDGGAGAYAGTGMRGGLITLGGSAGDFLAAAIPGNHQGMLGGTILVRGSAGDRAGDRMRRGTVLIEGDTGDYLASRMVAGTIAVGGTIGRFPGLAMRRGTVILSQAPAALLPTFSDCGTHPFTVLTLLARAWRRFPGKFAAFPETGLRVRRFMGDLGNDGRGEILIPA